MVGFHRGVLLLWPRHLLEGTPLSHARVAVTSSAVFPHVLTVAPVQPGATDAFRYTFEQAGEILAGCHEPGHYEAGMVAGMTVTD